MAKVCECGCGVEFTPQRSTARFASATCRVRAARNRGRRGEDVALVQQAQSVARVVSIGAKASGRASATGRRGRPRVTGRGSARDASSASGGREQGPIEARLLVELGDAAGTSLGLQALALARRMDDPGTTASALYSLSRQLVVLTAAALRDQAPDVEVDPVAAVQAQVVQMREEARNRARSAG